jgi:two-component system cell cycle sensor histidine kinase/response regulator CckA
MGRDSVSMSTAAPTPGNDHQKLSEALSLLDKTVLEMIMAERPIARVLETLCLRIEELSPGLICSVLLLNPREGTLESGIGPSLPASYLKAVNGFKIGPRAGSCGTAAYLQKMVVVTDIATDPLWDDYRQLASPHGLRACWSIPITSRDGATLGTFACYYGQPRTPDSYHLALINRASHLAGIAIETQRTKTELRAAEQRYRTLVERLPAITYIAEVGIHGRWHFVSPQIESMLGFSVEEWLADPAIWMRCIHEDDREIALAAEKRVQQTGALYQAEYRMHARNGRVFWFRDEANLLEGPEGSTPLMQGVLYDITEHKRLEDQLRQAQKMEAVGQLAGGVAHDFNNLLMVIQAHVDRIRGQLAQTDPCYPDAVEIHNATVRAASLTSQLLAFSRKQILQPRVLELGPVLNEVGKMLERLISAKITLRVETEPDLGRVKVDRGQLEQTIFNLAVNGRDAMPDGGTLSIRARNVHFREPQVWQHSSLQPGSYVELAVQDTGTGIEINDQPRLFEPFFTTKAPGKGTGLGLAMVYGVVKQSDGAILVESKPGRGSTFRIFLPRCNENEVPKQGDQEQPARFTGSETILLVEDQPAIREVTGDYLMRLGYKVLAAPDGEAALRIAATQQKSVDLVVTDVLMPNMGGRELAVRMKQLHPETKILFMSGYPDHAVRHQEGLTEDVEVLQKPFSLKSLAAKARFILDHRRKSSTQD